MRDQRPDQRLASDRPGRGDGIFDVTKRKRGSLSGTLGGIIVGFDQQIFRTTPPVQELVAKGQPVRGVSGERGAFEVVFPDEVPTETGASTKTQAPPADQGAGEQEPAAD